MQGGSLERNVPGMPHGMSGNHSWLLANGMVITHKEAHKKGNTAVT